MAKGIVPDVYRMYAYATKKMVEFGFIMDGELLQRYELTGDVAGTGQNGTVWVAIGRQGTAAAGQKVAIKSLRKPRASKVNCAQEAEILSSLDHPNIVKLTDVYDSGKQVHLVTEYLGGGELFTRIASMSKVGGFPDEMAKETCVQILQAVGHLHSRGILHRDLKLENFVYTCPHGDHIKLIDFGSACYAWQTMHGGGTPLYRAPEQHGPKASFTDKADVFSIGVIAFILLTGREPFTEDEGHLIKPYLEKSFQTKEFQRRSSQARSFARLLMNRDPSLRPSTCEALDHPWITGPKPKKTINNVSCTSGCCETLRVWLQTCARSLA